VVSLRATPSYQRCDRWSEFSPQCERASGVHFATSAERAGRPGGAATERDRGPPRGDRAAHARSGGPNLGARERKESARISEQATYARQVPSQIGRLQDDHLRRGAELCFSRPCSENVALGARSDESHQLRHRNHPGRSERGCQELRGQRHLPLRAFRPEPRAKQGIKPVRGATDGRGAGWHHASRSRETTRAAQVSGSRKCRKPPCGLRVTENANCVYRTEPSRAQRDR